MASRSELAQRSLSPVFRHTITQQYRKFGRHWRTRFERELVLSIDDIPKAVKAYCDFSMEAMRLQAEFAKTLKYAPAVEPYHDDKYMTDVYLPALLLSNYLWPHHYQVLQWFYANAIPSMRAAHRFCDVGTGTGFYSKELLVALGGIQGHGFDISKASVRYANGLMRKWDVARRWDATVGEIEPGAFDAFLCVELLEHLSFPNVFLRGLRYAMIPGAVGFVTAALDAANRDHIFLYRTAGEVWAHLETAGFTVLDSETFTAYEGDVVPRIAAFVVQANA